MLSNKEKYRLLCQEKPIPLFMQAWWMDAVCINSKEWDVLLSEKDDKIIGVLVFHWITKMGYKFILQPQLTQYNGVWIDYPDESDSSQKLSLEKKVMDELIQQLEKKKYNYYSQSFHCSITNWQPFYWQGYEQTTKYTYIIKDISNPDKVFEAFNHAKKKQIKKTLDEFVLDFCLTDNDLYNFHTQCLQDKKKKIVYLNTLLSSIYSSGIKRKQAQIIGIRDKENKLHAASLFVWDKDSAYNLITAFDRRNNASGASTRVVWEGLKFLSDKTKNFDFEGSMIEGVARSFQQFGAEQVQYFTIQKSNSALLSFFLKMKTIYANHR